MTTNAAVVPAEQYYDAYRVAFDKTLYPGFLSDFTLEELEAHANLACYLTPDNCTGVGVYHEDDKVYAIGLFNVGGIPGAGYSLFEHVVNHNHVTDIDAFEGVLTDMYRTLGFETVEKVDFDPQYAHHWNYERDGTPAVHFMRKAWG